MTHEREYLLKLVAEHTAYRGRTINLIASENALSPTVMAALRSDLVQRYGDYTGRDLGRDAIGATSISRRSSAKRRESLGRRSRRSTSSCARFRATSRARRC